MGFYLKFIGLLSEIIHGGYLTALIGPGLVLTTSILTKSALSIILLIISYLVPLIIYTHDYQSNITGDIQTNPERVLQLQKKEKYYKFIFLSYIIILVIILSMSCNFKLCFFMTILTLAGFFYGKFVKNLTKIIPLFKNLYVGLMAPLMGVFSILVYFSFDIYLSFILIFIFMYLRFGVNNIFCDLKDHLSDADEELKTLPVMIGTHQTLQFLHFLNLISFAPLIISVYLKIIPLFSISLLLFFFYTFYYLNKAKKTPRNLIKLGLISDLEFIFWPCVLFAFQISLY